MQTIRVESVVPREDGQISYGYLSMYQKVFSDFIEIILDQGNRPIAINKYTGESDGGVFYVSQNELLKLIQIEKESTVIECI